MACDLFPTPLNFPPLFFFGGGEERAPEGAQPQGAEAPHPPLLFFFLRGEEHERRNRLSWYLWESQEAAEIMHRVRWA